MKHLDLNENEVKLLELTEYKQSKIKKMMPWIVGLLTITATIYLVMAIRVSINRHVFQFFFDTGYTSLRPKSELWYPGFVLIFWRLVLISGFLFLLDVVMISYWYETTKNLNLIKKLHEHITR